MLLPKIKLLLIVAAVAGGVFAAEQSNSLYRRSVQDVRSRSMRGATSAGSEKTTSAPRARTSQKDGAYISARKASWISMAEPAPKGFRVHDLVTIMVHEVSKHSTKADTKSERSYAVDAKLEDWLKFSGYDLKPNLALASGDPKIKFSSEQEFEGKGDVKREDSLSARIQAEIIDVMPNGNLLLEAIHTVSTDNDTTTITLTGICRSNDVGIDNTLLSSQLHNLNVTKSHKGLVRDATRRGWLLRLVDALSPF